MANDVRTTTAGRPPANTQTRVRRSSAPAQVLAMTQAPELFQEWVWSALRQLRALCSNQWLFSMHLSQPLSSFLSQLYIRTTNHAPACRRMTSQEEVWASTNHITISTSPATCLTPSRPRNMSASEGVVVVVAPAEVDETTCLEGTTPPPVGLTLLEHLLVGHQHGTWFIIRVVTTREVDLVQSSRDLRML